VGIFLISLSAYVLLYLTVTESFFGTLFPTGITAIIIGAVGVKLILLSYSYDEKEINLLTFNSHENFYRDLKEHKKT